MIAGRKRRCDSEEQNASKLSRSSSSSSSVIFVSEDRPIITESRFDRLIGYTSRLLRKLFGGQSRSRRPRPPRQAAPPIPSGTSVSYISQTSEAMKGSTKVHQAHVYRSYYLTNDEETSTSGHSHQHVTTPSHPVTTPTKPVTTPTKSSPKQKGPTIHIKSPKRKLKSPPSERKYASITKSHSSTAGVLDRLTRERDDAIFQDMLRDCSQLQIHPPYRGTSSGHTHSPYRGTPSGPARPTPRRSTSSGHTHPDSIGSLTTSPTLSSHYAAPPTLMPMKSSGVHLFSTDVPSHRSHSLSTSHQLRPLSILRDPSITLTTPPTLPRPSTVTRPFQSPVSSGTIHSFVPVPVHQSRDRFGSNPEELSFDSSKTTPIISPINMKDFFENNKWLEDFNINQASKFTDYKPRIEAYKKYNQIYQRERIEAEDRRNQKQLERMRNLLIRRWSPGLEGEEEGEELMLELSPELSTVVDAVWGLGPPQEVFAEHKNVRITRYDLQTLSGLEWLNDEIINFYLTLTVDTVNESAGGRKVHLFNSFFYPKIMSAGYPGIRRWTKKVDIFSYDLILLPVHLGMHWCLAAIDFNRKYISYYDSLMGTNTRCLKVLSEYLMLESRDKRKIEYDTSDWTLECCKDIPRQENGSDCGVFTCMYARHLARDKPMNFSQSDLQAVRRLMVAEIVSKKLLLNDV